MANFFKSAFTEVDNETFDISKVLGALSVVSAIFLEGWHVIVHNAPFNMQDFGIGTGALFAGLAAVFGFKKDSPH
jgi:hypothetical protein